MHAGVPLLTLIVALWVTGTARAEGAGFADLHAHPASSLAFGYQRNPSSCVGEEGIFRGHPGGALDLRAREATMATDLRPCEPQTHSDCPNPSIIQNRQRQTLIGLLENKFGGHLAEGHSSFEGWPNASSRTHQQMHGKWLRRAFEGGLRFMIASITDNEMLAKYYDDDHGCDIEGHVFRPSAGAAFASAKRQIAFVENFARDNAEWIEVVDTPERAQSILATGKKLVIVLGVELDNLTLEETLQLIDKHRVRSVIPIHMVNNSFGGAAVHDGLLNTPTTGTTVGSSTSLAMPA
jgi:hypothetical protein